MIALGSSGRSVSGLSPAEFMSAPSEPEDVRQFAHGTGPSLPEGREVGLRLVKDVALQPNRLLGGGLLLRGGRFRGIGLNQRRSEIRSDAQRSQPRITE